MTKEAKLCYNVYVKPNLATRVKEMSVQGHTVQDRAHKKEKRRITMKLKTKITTALLSVCAAISAVAISASAAATHTVERGESMWKIAVKYEIGLDEIKRVNPQIQNASLIYPGQVINIPSVDDKVLEFEKEVIRLVNAQRAKAGLGALKHNWQLSRVARFKSEDMSDRKYFSHTSPTYGSPFEMIKNFGISYKTVGENIAKGYADPNSVVDRWMNSSGHRANILNSEFKEIGVGYCPDGKYWTQMFIA